MHLLEGHNTRSWQMWPLHSAVCVPKPVDEIYFLIINIIKKGRWFFLLKNMLNLIFLLKNMFCQQDQERVQLSVGVLSVSIECYDLPTGTSDHVWHHPSVLNTYFPLRMYFWASSSRMPMVKRGRLLRRPGGSEVRCKGKIRVQYWRMVSNVVRCTRLNVFTSILYKCDPHTK